jgi:hypothetical protein
MYALHRQWWAVGEPSFLPSFFFLWEWMNLVAVRLICISSHLHERQKKRGEHKPTVITKQSIERKREIRQRRAFLSLPSFTQSSA